MSHCATCNEKFSDGTVCSSCRKSSCFSCSAISESGYRKLGADRRATWKCPACRSTSPSPSTLRREINLDDVVKKLDEMAIKLDQLPKLFKEVNFITTEIQDIRKSCEFSCQKIDEFETKLTSLSSQMETLGALRDEMIVMKKTVDSLQQDYIDKDQWSRLNNVEIKGVPLKNNENLFEIVDKVANFIGYPLSKSYINYISRIPIYKSKEKTILLSFVNRYVKEEFISAARGKKQISTSDIGYYSDIQNKIFVNDHLSPFNKKLLTRVKSLCKESSFKYSWVRYAKIHVRKNDTSPVVIINSVNDLNKIK